MSLINLFNEINSEVKDIYSMGFELTQTQGNYVPNYEDPGLTFETGKVKRAKIIETCVLYTDIRNSTTLSANQSREVMARLYTAFVKSILYISEYHGGVVRNIIGDRVMVVFPKNNCFQNAIEAAISINTVMSRIIDKHFVNFDFKCGIGIDFGEMKVIKTGLPKKNTERTNYKNIIWIGNPANIASKLTDIANKEITKTKFKVTRHPINPKAFKRHFKPGILPSSMFGKLERDVKEPLHLSTIETIILSPEEFANNITQLSTGEIYTLNGKLIKFEKVELKEKPAPILISQEVWDGFNKSNRTHSTIKSNLWTTQITTLKEYKKAIIGGDIYWTDINKVIF